MNVRTLYRGYVDGLAKLANIELKWDATQQRSLPGQQMPSAKAPKPQGDPAAQQAPAVPDEVTQTGPAAPEQPADAAVGAAPPPGMMIDPVQAENQRLQTLVENAKLRLQYTQLEQQIAEAKNPATAGAAAAVKTRASGSKGSAEPKAEAKAADKAKSEKAEPKASGKKPDVAGAAAKATVKPSKGKADDKDAKQDKKPAAKTKDGQEAKN